MALVETCYCCSVPIAAGFLAAYLLVAYLIAFAFELLWILESSTALPMAAVLLCAGYFAMALFAALLIHGLATKNALCLISWMFSVTILTFPEAGLVIYMSIQYWRIESIYGITELTSWLVRILINVVQLILIQSLYSMWKDEEIVLQRLKDLNMTAIQIPTDIPPLHLNSMFYQNNGFDHSMEQLSNLKRFGSTPQLWNNMVQMPYDGLPIFTSPSEFNASIFVPTNYINNDQILGKKAQSLMDLRLLTQPSINQQQDHLWDLQHSADQIDGPINDENPNMQNTDSPRMVKCASVDALNNKDQLIIKNRTGFYAQPLENYGVPIYYGPLDGPDFLIYKKQVDKLTSKNSLSNASQDDVQKYRDVAL